MSEFGAHLKQARESRGISLRQISTSTKIATVALEALERGDLSKLPGGIFSRAFVRAYAIEVGLDPDEVVEWFLKEQSKQADQAEEPRQMLGVSPDDRAFLEQQRRAAFALRIALVVLLVVIIAGVAYWQVSRSRQVTSRDLPVPTPVTAAPEASAPEVSAETPTTEEPDAPPTPNASERDRP